MALPPIMLPRILAIDEYGLSEVPVVACPHPGAPNEDHRNFWTLLPHSALAGLSMFVREVRAVIS